MANSDSDLLDILNAAGEQFLASFGQDGQDIKKRKRSTSQGSSSRTKMIKPDDEEEEEWLGITQQSRSSSADSDSEEGLEDFEQEDDDFAASTSFRPPAVVVFSDAKPQRSGTTKAQMKAFMSSKVSKLRAEAPAENGTGDTQDEKDDEKTNLQNDAILHKLVHTKLLSGSLNSELDLTPAHRRKALAGRVLELSGGAKIGKGEKAVREAERNKAAQRVRVGIVDKQKEKGKQQLEEAKNLGNYHPTIKKLFESSSSTSTHASKRDRGLKMGVGKFSGGMLTLSRDEIDMVQGGSRGRGRGGRGRGGGGRGRGSNGRGRGSSRGAPKRS